MRLLSCVIFSGSSFYLPGVAPTDYDDGEEVDLMVTQLNSRRTQLPYDFYTLPVCRPERIDNQHLSLGEEEAYHLKQLVDDEYVVNMLVDSLPAAMPNGATDGYVTGFPIGLKDQTRYYLYNHFSFTFNYYRVEESYMTRRDDRKADYVNRIVFFEVEPKSIDGVCADIDAKLME